MSRTISNSDDILDTRDVLERIKELEDDDATKPWVAGWNLPAHSPDTPYEAFATWAEAQEYLIAELENTLENKLHDGMSIIDRDQVNGMYQRIIDAVRDQQEESGRLTVGADGWVFCIEPNDHFDPELKEELGHLEKFAEEIEGYCNMKDGETLIRDDYFEEYAEQLASDISDYNPKEARWPYTHIDWEAAAEELKQDYTSAEWDGQEYWFRTH